MNVAVITGAANGIGLALSQVYLDKGSTVVMVDINKNKLHNEAEKLSTKYPRQILALPCDITKTEQVTDLAQKTISSLGRIDWLYNNAGIIGQLAPVWELNPEQIQQVMNVNVQGMIYMIQAFMPFLLKQNTASQIVNIASLYSLCTSSQTAAYSMSKHAVLALSESLHFDLARIDKPITVSVAFPSFTDTELLAQSPESNPDFHHTLQSMLSHSRPAREIAQHIVQEVDEKKFYIFPDREVKGYCDERTKAIIFQEEPVITSVEKLMGVVMRRSK